MVKKLHLDKRAEKLIGDLDGLADDLLLNTKDTANLLGVSESWLERGRLESYSYGPPWISLAPRCLRYRVSDLRRWLRWRPNRPGGRVRLRLREHEGLSMGA